jgi:hypothetical protein
MNRNHLDPQLCSLSVRDLALPPAAVASPANFHAVETDVSSRAAAVRTRWQHVEIRNARRSSRRAASSAVIYSGMAPRSGCARSRAWMASAGHSPP